jgi:hypothetical protein
MKDEGESVACLRSDTGQHHWKVLFQNRASTSMSDRYAFWGFEAFFAGKKIPGFRSCMRVNRRVLPRRNHSYQIPGCVAFDRRMRKRPNDGHTLASRGMPVLRSDREQPDLSELLDNALARCLFGACGSATRRNVQVPE